MRGFAGSFSEDLKKELEANDAVKYVGASRAGGAVDAGPGLVELADVFHLASYRARRTRHDPVDMLQKRHRSTTLVIERSMSRARLLLPLESAVPQSYTSPVSPCTVTWMLKDRLARGQCGSCAVSRGRCEEPTKLSYGPRTTVKERKLDRYVLGSREYVCELKLRHPLWFNTVSTPVRAAKCFSGVVSLQNFDLKI